MELIEILDLLDNANAALKDYSGKEEVSECRYVAQNFLQDAIGFLSTAIYGYEDEIKEQVEKAASKRPLKTPKELDAAIEDIVKGLRQLESEIEGWGDGNHPETWLAHNGDANQCCLKELEAIKSDWELLIQDMTRAKNEKEREINNIFEELQSVKASYNKEGKQRIDNDLIVLRSYLQKGK